MCGICGVVRFNGDSVDLARLDRACAELKHRGPDHTGTWTDASPRGSVGLGAVRLAVLDPTPAANQPAHAEDGRFHLVFNGEIYNFRELRRTLIAEGAAFVTDGDTEVVLAACVRWGVDALDRFNGMWALAFYDGRSHCGFLARDRFGIKPLLYRVDKSGLSFASELRGLTCLADDDWSINQTAVREHVQFGYIAHPRTVFAEACRLPPAHYLTFDASGVGEPNRYYRPAAADDSTSTMGYGEACADMRRRIADAVVARRVSDVPIGAFLSGGLDSSIIVCHLVEAIGPDVKTFSLGYTDQKAYDESDYAALVASHFGTDHHELRVTDREVIAAVPRVLDHLGEPVGDSSIIPTSLISAFARKEVTVVLGGDGSDELFGGYWRYVGHQALAAYARLPGWLRRLAIEPLVRSGGSSKSSPTRDKFRQFRKLLRGLGSDAFERHVAWSRILAPEAEGVLSDAKAVAGDMRGLVERARAMTADAGDEDVMNRILAFDLQHSLPADMLQKVDLASMMHSLEVRVPFLDPTVVAGAVSLPSCFKIHRGRRKRILVDAYRGRIPDAVLDRPKKGFEVPVGEYFRGPLREMLLDTVTKSALGPFGCLSFDGFERVYADHVARRGEHADVLFALLSLCWWRRRWWTGC
ncbi:MAG: asparagine synthase (glutamine-hydrolyzing) [Planctomycetes bacterium]|nr:asparagine synthase (glutamine-hydrolyzing) [Planctomycetota bacterium]